jgi:hypothetical protein
VYALMRRYLRERDKAVPYVVQANKRDAADAVPIASLRSALRLPADLPLLPAVASTGEGVRQTFNAAVKAAIRFAHAQVSEHGIQRISGPSQNADELLDALLSLEDVEDRVEEEEPTEDDLIDAEAS